MGIYSQLRPDSPTTTVQYKLRIHGRPNRINDRIFKASASEINGQMRKAERNFGEAEAVLPGIVGKTANRLRERSMGKPGAIWHWW